MPCCELLVSLYREHVGYVQCQSSLDEGAAPEAEGFMPRPRGHADNRSGVTTVGSSPCLCYGRFFFSGWSEKSGKCAK